MSKTIATLVALTMVLSTPFSGARAQETQIAGFVDAAWFYDAAAENGEFSLDQVEVDITHQASEKTALRADLEWVKDGEGYAAQVEQAFMTYIPRCGWAFTFGKFNAPIGFEAIDAPDMYQYSHSLVYDHGSPTNLSGAMLTKELGAGLDLQAHVSNGWDRATADKNVTWGGRLGYERDALGAGLAVISGTEEQQGENEGDPATLFTRTVIDVDLSYGAGAWTFGGELNRGQIDLPADAEATWMGFLLMAHLDFNDRMGLTVRCDFLDDEDGYLLGDVGGEFQHRQAIAIAPTLVLDDGFGALVELRIDKSDRDAFLDGDGDPTDTATSLAFEMTYSW